MRVGYPVAIDSDHAIWRAFRNQYGWPSTIIDAQGSDPTTTTSAKVSYEAARERVIQQSCWPKPAGRQPETPRASRRRRRRRGRGPTGTTSGDCRKRISVMRVPSASRLVVAPCQGK